MTHGVRGMGKKAQGMVGRSLPSDFSSPAASWDLYPRFPW